MALLTDQAETPMTRSPLSLQARHPGLGMCKGCQLMALSGWIPGGFLQDVEEPRFVHDASGRFERCWSTVNCSHSSKRLAGQTPLAWAFAMGAS